MYLANINLVNLILKDQLEILKILKLTIKKKGKRQSVKVEVL